MKAYTIKKGQHDFKPRDGFGLIWWPKIKKRVLTVEFEFGKDALFDPGNDKDLQHDWNKLPGISLGYPWTKKNKNAIMVGWRPKDGEFLECTFYINRDFDHNAPDHPRIDLRPGERAGYAIWPTSKSEWRAVFYAINEKGQFTSMSEQLRIKHRSSFLMAPIGLWFGGNKTAPQDMSIYVNRGYELQSELKKKNLM